MQRSFRPGRVVPSGGTTWLTDESWPVAVVLTDDAAPRVVSWPRPSTDIRPELDGVVVGDGVGIVVRSGESVVWVRVDGVVTASVGADLLLSAADADTAWLVDWTTVDPGSPPEPAPPLPAGEVLAVHRDGTRTRVTTPAPAISVAVRGDDVWITMAEPAVAHPGDLGSWSFEYPTSVLRVPRRSLLAGSLAGAVRVGERDAPLPPRVRPSAWSWLEHDPATVLRYGERVGGLVWWVGTPPGSDKVNRRVEAVGHDPSGGSPVVRVDLGPGVAGDVQATGDELWVTIARRRWLAVPRDHGVDVVAVSTTGAVRTVLPAASIDISRFAPPLRRPSEQQIDRHVREVRERFADLDRFWQSEDGTTSPLSRGLHDSSATVDGAWPDVRLVLTFRHPSRPGLLLRRTLALFDETGAPNELPYADIHLMEQLDTGYVAPAEEAHDGVLDT